MSTKLQEVPAASTLASTLNPLSPRMPLAEASRWLHDFFSRELPYLPGDDLGTGFCSFAAVMLSAMVVGTDSAVILSSVTSYPAPYVAAVLDIMHRSNAWDFENVLALKTQLTETPTDSKELQIGLNDAMQQVWEVVATRDAVTPLDSLRRGALYGGKTQNWLDEDALAFFKLA